MQTTATFKMNLFPPMFLASLLLLITNVYAASSTGDTLELRVGQQIELAPVYAHAQAVEWSFGDGTVSNQQSTQHHYAQSGLYKITHQVGEGECISLTEQWVRVTEVPLETNEWVVFPNPSQGELNIQVSGAPISHLQIIEATGKLIVDQQLTQTQTFQYTTTRLPAGTYIVRIQQGEHWQQKYWVKQ